jgi:hypothetical protein
MSAENFCINAEVYTVYDVPIEKESLMQFLSQPKTFEDYMPSVKAVRRIGTSKSGLPLYEWQYDVEMPLAPTLHVSIPTEFCKNGAVFTHHTPDEQAQDWMMCQLAFETAPHSTPDEPHTLVKMQLQIRLQRPSGTDFHPLSPLMGQAFMCTQMKNRMQSIANTFVHKSVNVLYEKLHNSK